MFCDGAALEVTVPVTVPAVSWALAGRFTLRVAVRPLWTSMVPAVAVYPVAAAEIITASGLSRSPVLMIVIGTTADV
jgi:hypothetical protein